MDIGIKVSMNLLLRLFIDPPSPNRLPYISRTSSHTMGTINANGKRWCEYNQFKTPHIPIGYRCGEIQTGFLDTKMHILNSVTDSVENHISSHSLLSHSIVKACESGLAPC